MRFQSKRVQLLCAAGVIAALGACSPADRSADANRTAAPGSTAARPSAPDKAGQAATDTAITAKVKSALLADASVKGMKIEVETREGTVTLSGTAASAAEKAQAERLAAAVEGVRNVVNRISVS